MLQPAMDARHCMRTPGTWRKRSASDRRILTLDLFFCKEVAPTGRPTLLETAPPLLGKGRRALDLDLVKLHGQGLEFEHPRQHLP
jgi:hypothetical protein